MKIFQTLREFNNQFPSKLFICPSCNKLTSNKYQCEFCNFQSNNIANLNGEYEIKELNLKDKILPPLETLKGKRNDTSNKKQGESNG